MEENRRLALERKRRSLEMTNAATTSNVINEGAAGSMSNTAQANNAEATEGTNKRQKRDVVETTGADAVIERDINNNNANNICNSENMEEEGDDDEIMDADDIADFMD